MNDHGKEVALKIKLKQLKDEEEFILKTLKDVQNQLKKYEVEELQTSSELVANPCDNVESDSDDSIDGNPESLLKILDCAELINDASLNLNINKIFGKEDDEEECEESEDDDSD